MKNGTKRHAGRDYAATQRASPPRLINVAARHKVGTASFTSEAAGRPPRMQPGEPIVEGAACAVELAHQVAGIAVDEAGRRAFVACARSNAVAAVSLDGKPEPWQIQVGREPIPAVVDVNETLSGMAPMARRVLS